VADDPLREQLLRPPAEAWRPEPGDLVIGEVVELGERRGFAERPYPVVIVRTEAGEYVAVHAFHTVLKEELAKLEPRAGDRLGVAYHGLVEKGESRYELYRVALERAGGEERAPDWEAIARDAAAERDVAAVPANAREPEPLIPPESSGDDEIPF
jgi:hypothetical protein